MDTRDETRDEVTPPRNGAIPAAGQLLELPVKWGWLLALGLAMAALGGLGLGFTFSLTIAGVLLFGALALAGGLLQLWHGIAGTDGSWGGRGLHLLVAVAYLLLGGLLLWDPLRGSLSLTLAFAAFLLVIGGFRGYYAWRFRQLGWSWKLAAFASAVDILLAVLIIAGWPSTGLWVIGLFLAIEMLFTGSLLTALALTVRKSQREGGDTHGSVRSGRDAYASS